MSCRYGCLVRLCWRDYCVCKCDQTVLVLVEWTDKLWRSCNVVWCSFTFTHHHVVQILLSRRQSHKLFFATSITNLAHLLRWRYMTIIIGISVTIAVLNKKLSRFGRIESTLFTRVPLLLHESLLMLLEVIRLLILLLDGGHARTLQSWGVRFLWLGIILPLDLVSNNLLLRTSVFALVDGVEIVWD